MTDKPDATDVESLKRFFERNIHCTTHELAMLADRSPTTIYNWKKKCNITRTGREWTGKPSGGPPFSKKPKYKKYVVDQILDKSVWDNRRWFHQKYVVECLGSRILSRITGVSAVTVIKRLKRYGIERRKNITSKNKCCNREWIEEHYIKQELPIAECAGAAKVSTYTIYKWLVKFKIPIRDVYEAGVVGQKRKHDKSFIKRSHAQATKRTNSRSLRISS